MTPLRLATPVRLALIVGGLCFGLLRDAPPALATVCPNPPVQATLKFQGAPPDVSFTSLPSPTPIKIVLQVANTSGGDVLTTTGFSSTDFFRRLQLIGPAGTTINKSEETLHAVSQTFYCLSRGGTNLGTPASPAGIPVVPVEVLPPTFFREYVIDDARTLYSLNQPGHYSLNMQFDLLTFESTAQILDCDQFPGTTLVPVDAITGRNECTVQSNTLEFLFAGPPAAANSRIRGSSPVVADGVHASTIEITLNDANNIPVSGVTPPPTFSATGSNNTIGPCAATNISGVYNCTLKSTTAEIKTLSITSPVSRLGGTVTFTPGTLTSLTISPSSSTIALGGSEFYTAQGKDANGNTFDATSTTSFKVGTTACTGTTCTPTSAGTKTVTGTNSGKTATATLKVESPPAGTVKAWIGLATSDDVGLKFDIKAIVKQGGVEVGTGQLGSVAGGSGFPKALLNSIALYAPSGPITLASGDTLELLARNACAGSSKTSGKARLWYNGANVDSGTTKDAGSRLELPTGPTHFLRTGSPLSLLTNPGSSRTFIDVTVGAKCGPYQSFGIWKKP